MIKKTLSTLSLTAVTICLSIPAFAMLDEDDFAPKSCPQRMDNISMPSASGCTVSRGQHVDIMTELEPPSPEQLQLVKKEITELTRKRSSLDPFQAIEDKNEVELSTLLAALNEQFEIEYQIDLLIRKIPLYQTPYVTFDPCDLSEQRRGAVRQLEDRMSVIAQKRKEITERLELLTKSSDE
ncbi:MAG: hypothetical protein K2Y08_02600 [Alphaproteobacteria bacterium]|nr:hypothetical protein [Alphaproteobacteria bacterium]